MTPATTPKSVSFRPDAVILHCLLGALFLGIVAMLSLPAARGYNAWLGALPLWLLGMPVTAIAASRLVRRLPLARQAVAANRRNRGNAGAPARRRSAMATNHRFARAA